MSKPGKVLKRLCKRLGVRLTVKRNGKRIYKSIKVLKAQCKRKKKKVVKKKKFVKRKRRFGSTGKDHLSYVKYPIWYSKHRNLLSKINKHTNTKESPFREKIKNYLPTMSNTNNCWIHYIRNVSMSEYYKDGPNLKTVFYFNPEQDDKFLSNDNTRPIRNWEYYTTFDFRNKMLALIYKDIMMLDYDYKDPAFNNGIKKLIKFSNANNMTFIKFNTDRGQHFFLGSHKFDHKDVLSSHIMMSLDIDQWYTAFCYAIGYGIRINTKEGRREDKVAFRSSIKPGALTPEESKLVFEELEKGDYSSNNVILRKGNIVQVSEPTVSIKLSDGKVYKFRYMDKKFYKDDGIEKHIIGDIKNVDNSIWKKIMFQYFLIQYFVTIKNYNSKKTSILECDIGEKLLNSKKKPNLVDEIRKDIKIIWKFINSKLNFTDRDKKKLVIEEYEPDEILLKPYNYPKGKAYLTKGLLVGYGKRKRKRKKRKKKK